MHQRNYLYVALVAFAGVLSGCGGNDTDAPIVSATPAADTAAPAAPVNRGPVALEDVLSSTDGSLRQVHLDALDAIEAGMSCSLDSVNGATPGSAPIGRDGALSLSGWFQHKHEARGNVIAVLRGGKAYAFPMIAGDVRPDVAKVIGSTDAISDVSAATGLGDLPAGEYAVYYVRSDDAGLAKCVADRKIVVN